MLFDNDQPRYLPHMDNPEVLLMGLCPMRDEAWFETDNHLARYYRHKLDYRQRYADRAYRATPSSELAQRELAALILEHLTTQQPALYQRQEDMLRCPGVETSLAVESEQPLWNCSLWVADDLVLMEEIDGQYCLTAASLCCPSHWRLEEKFGRPLTEIHDPIPGFHRELTPRIDRFFKHLKPQHPVVRFNWSIQAYDSLSQRPEDEQSIMAGQSLYYRCERQSLVRLPESNAIAFTIRVYLHPLEALAGVPNAMTSLFDAIDGTPQALSRYKGFPQLEPALLRYREGVASS